MFLTGGFLAPKMCTRSVSPFLGGAAACAMLISVAFAEARPDVSEPVTAGNGWMFDVVARNLPGIDNLVLAEDDSLYATQELPFGAGKVVRVNRGEVATVVSGLSRPDGLLLREQKLFITEETANGRLLEYDLSEKKLRILALLNKPEGVDMSPDGDLVVSEDAIEGRLLLVRRDGQAPTKVLLEKLKRPEGLIVRADGSIVFAETASGRVLSYRNGEVNVVVGGLAWPDQVELAPDGALWITEDVADGRLLRFQDGAIERVLSGLRSPQGMAIGADGAVWVAEYGRQRILLVRPRCGSE